jgi:hypothetical protein
MTIAARHDRPHRSRRRRSRGSARHSRGSIGVAPSLRFSAWSVPSYEPTMATEPAMATDALISDFAFGDMGPDLLAIGSREGMDRPFEIRGKNQAGRRERGGAFESGLDLAAPHGFAGGEVKGNEIAVARGHHHPVALDHGRGGFALRLKTPQQFGCGGKRRGAHTGECRITTKDWPGRPHGRGRLDWAAFNDVPGTPVRARLPRQAFSQSRLEAGTPIRMRDGRYSDESTRGRLRAFLDREDDGSGPGGTRRRPWDTRVAYTADPMFISADELLGLALRRARRRRHPRRPGRSSRQPREARPRPRPACRASSTRRRSWRRARRGSPRGRRRTRCLRGWRRWRWCGGTRRPRDFHTTALSVMSPVERGVDHPEVADPLAVLGILADADVDLVVVDHRSRDDVVLRAAAAEAIHRVLRDSRRTSR